MTYLAMNEYTTSEWTFEEDVRHYVRAGFEGIGINIAKIRSHDLRKVVNLVRENHLIVSELCSAGNLVNKDLYVQKLHIENALQLIYAANTLEAKALILLAGFDPSLSHLDSLSALRFSLEAILPIAERYNVRLALEPLHPMYRESLSFLVSLGETIDIVNQFDSEYLGIWLDTQHIWWDKKVSENILRAKNKIFGAHINDCLQNSTSLSSWELPGRGIIPLRNILSTISLTGWRGMFSVEVISENIHAEDYPEILDYCNTWFQNINLQ